MSARDKLDRTAEATPTRFGDGAATLSRSRGGYRPRTRLKGEQGYILAMTALLLVPLMAFVSFAIDAGAWYAQTSRMQRAADAAALAAVVYLPNTTAAAAARDAVAAQNGFTTGVTGTVTSPTKYQVTIQANGQRFFSSTFDPSAMNLSRSATAEFNKPIPLGSPTNKMGNDVASCPQFQPSQTAPCGPQPMLWSSIQGPNTQFQSGDPYTTKCARTTDPTAAVSAAICSSGTGVNGATNDLYKPNGYSFAIDVKAADVGRNMPFQVWDAGSYGRSVGLPYTEQTTVVSMTSGSNLLTRVSGAYNFVAADVGRVVVGTGIPVGATIATRISNTQVRISANVTSSSASRTVTIRTPRAPDCDSTLPPFNAAPYSGSIGSQNCQTGDRGSSPFELQIFENDGSDLTTNFTTPIAGCRLYVGPGADLATYKNRWATVCNFTPTQVGVYPVRVKSSNIAGVTDTGDGQNNFSMRLSGSPAASRLYAIDDLSIWTNTPSSDARFYLAEVGTEHQGKRLQLDLYDPGDGNGGDFTMQVFAPPSGAPNPVPTGGSTIPAAGLADSCRYNDTPSTFKGPNVTAPAGNVANLCTVTTRVGGVNKYNNHWLRIEIRVSDTYTCTTDCWWSIRYDFGGSVGIPTDRTVWSLTIVGDPVHLTE